MRTLAVLVAGVALGCIMTLAAVQVAGGWYTYSVVPLRECQNAAANGIGPLIDEVVPNQPNPCHFRRPRWQLFH